MERKINSHKGDNGKVMVVGGSKMFHGAPILCSLGAEYSGVDLVFPFIPPIQAEAAKTYSLNFIIQTFEGNVLTNKDVKSILNFSRNVDVVVVGPGLGTDPKTKTAVKNLLSHLNVPTVVDASALLYTNSLPKSVTLTPHRGEFRELTGDDPTPDNVQKWAKNLNATIVCKGPEDIIADRDELAINDTGNAMMTVGGTGDVLSGLIGGLIAQGMTPFDAGQYATKILGKAAENLADIQSSIRAIDLARSIPGMMFNN
ncbi:NAD(P)H-hydrate dehydratase [Patescibacteria group bacterium]|nr:NAD(P)H-hydrate dehydratase [Patescibacteria group bacterium]MBU1935233.1 NAD(P)H-hydrate dehydratase [Patescibacteria group bacterium]